MYVGMCMLNYLSCLIIMLQIVSHVITTMQSTDGITLYASQILIVLTPTLNANTLCSSYFYVFVISVYN